MAELERNVIKERVRAGLEYARVHGTKSGKAIGRPRLVFDREEVCRLRGEGLSIEKIARQMRLSVGTVVRATQNPPSDSRTLQTPPTPHRPRAPDPQTLTNPPHYPHTH